MTARPTRQPGLRQHVSADDHVAFVDLRAQTRALQPALTAAMEAVLRRGDFVLGEDVSGFEREFAAYCGVDQAVGVDSGLSALELALRAAGIGRGDEVITQANTFIATVSAILAVGARPVLADCDPQGAVDPAAVAACISPLTAAIIPVHLFGRIGDMEAILSLASGSDRGRLSGARCRVAREASGKLRAGRGLQLLPGQEPGRLR